MRARPSGPRRLYRLRRSVEVFVGRDGALRLLRLGGGDDLELSDVDPDERALLRALSARFMDPEGLRVELGIQAERIEALLGQLAAAELLEVRELPRPLDSHAAERFDRQLVYFADLVPAQTSADRLQVRLGSAHVAVIGCGGLGSWVACELSCAGVGTLTLIDDDRVELSNLNRQALYRESEIGERKVEAARRALRARNSALCVRTACGRIESRDDVLELLGARPDLVVCTADWPPHELPRWVNSACLSAGVPWLGAGQFPPHLRVGPLVIPGRSACHDCLETAVRRDHPLYDEVAEWRSRGHTPDPSVGPVSAVIGSLLASEALHHLLGAFAPASTGAALHLDLRTMEMTREPIARDPGCLSCRDAPAVLARS